MNRAKGRLTLAFHKGAPYTVQEHLTAVFDKVGVRSRGELVGQVFFRHCLPEIPD